MEAGSRGGPTAAAGAFSGAQEFATAPRSAAAHSLASPPREAPRRGERTPIYSSSTRCPARTKGLSWHRGFARWVPEWRMGVNDCCLTTYKIRHGSREPFLSPFWDTGSGRLDGRQVTIGENAWLPRQVLLEPGSDFPRPGVPSELRFLEKRHSVAQHFEPAASRRNQLDSGAGVPVSELSRQTGGSGLVVSERAVFDRDVHETPCRDESRLARIGLCAQESGSPGS